MPKLIRNWEELKAIPNESETHILKVDLRFQNGRLKAKYQKEYDMNKEYMEQVKNLDVYLSTHTFYGSHYEGFTEILQACGFDVKLANWDELGI